MEQGAAGMWDRSMYFWRSRMQVAPASEVKRIQLDEVIFGGLGGALGWIRAAGNGL